MTLDQQITVVTGAASGIGLATARAFAAAGATLYLGDIDEAGGAKAADAISAAGGSARFVRLDVTDPISVENFAQHVLAASERCDIVANVAGWSRNEPFVQNTPEFWDQIIALNLMGPVRISRAFVAGMMERGSGRIVNVASDAGRVGSLGETVYAAAKGGVIAFSKSLAREGARFNVHVNCVCPGPTDTPLMAKVPEKIKQAFAKVTPMRRLAKPEEIANAIVYLASPQASFITGQVISVSGGLTMHG